MLSFNIPRWIKSLLRVRAAKQPEPRGSCLTIILGAEMTEALAAFTASAAAAERHAAINAARVAAFADEVRRYQAQMRETAIARLGGNDAFEAQVRAYATQIATRFTPCPVFASPTRPHIISEAAQPDPAQADTLGWRAWTWSVEKERLISPHHHAIWDGPELRVDTWDESDVLRGVAGIHARRMPKDWRKAGWVEGHYQEGPPDDPNVVSGVVERFGRFVLGSLGWRAEWVIIRELQAPNTAIMKKLMEVYPDVKVHLKECQ